MTNTEIQKQIHYLNVQARFAIHANDIEDFDAICAQINELEKQLTH